jgi:signal transduction histidine kinase/CheY-like chemotaxis protein
METKKRIGIVGIATIVGPIIAIILVMGTIFTGRHASGDTGKAVRNVTLLFMDELANRREQVVASKLSSYINDLDVAVGLLGPEDLASTVSLQNYQLRMKQLYGLEKFAFVDTAGIIYTSRGTRTDIDLYNFDYKTLAKPEISLKKNGGEKKTIIVAMPVDRLSFNGKILVVCFMEIDMNHMLEGISLESDRKGITFCNLYSKAGNSLTNLVLGGLASGDNLLAAMENAIFEKGFSMEKMRSDFDKHEAGVVSFEYNGIRETMYYVPIHSTDWMLTYLIRESVISEQIGSISEGILERSLMLSGFIALVLLGAFLFLFKQTRRAAQLKLEKEVADAESRIKQEELEEQLALQQKLVEEERKRNEQGNMITALASDYRSVYYLNLDTGKAICYRKDNTVPAPFNEGDEVAYLETFTTYAEKFVDPEYREKFLEFIQPENVRTGVEKNKIYTLRYLTNHDGKEVYEMLRMAGVRNAGDGQDAALRVVGFGFSDIDEEMRDSLAKSQALSDALKTAEEASKAKTIFLSNMSHEIRTPMNAIIGLDSLALHEPEISEKTKGYLEKIGTSAEHLLSLINEILDMSRIESGRTKISSEEFSFPKLLEQVNTIFDDQCQEKGLKYSCHVAGNLDDYYVGDITKIRQVLINILGNAVKFTPKGGSVSLDVEKTASFDNKSTLVFKVSDTGVGISKEFLPKIFETFTQEDTSAGFKYGSSGLGMAITKGIVDMMNGKIEVESEKGKGTTFRVTLTLNNSVRKQVSDEEIEIHPNEMTVLVVDDDEIALGHAKLVLGKAGILTDTTLTGKEAVEMAKLRHARREPYNLIVIDWQMPEMNGIETAREIRKVTGDESAIIILTAYNWDDILDEALAAGVDCFISKPVFSGILLDEFKNALRRKKEHTSFAKNKAELTGRRVLLAEDMEVNAQIMMEVLKMRGLEAELAINGREALEMFRSHPEGYYDAILMDVRMPEMDGLEATVAIRKLDRDDAKKVPIIALTANAFDEDVQRSLQAGMNAHLSKPIQPEHLYQTLEELIQ